MPKGVFGRTLGFLGSVFSEASGSGIFDLV